MPDNQIRRGRARVLRRETCDPFLLQIKAKPGFRTAPDAEPLLLQRNDSSFDPVAVRIDETKIRVCQNDRKKRRWNNYRDQAAFGCFAKDDQVERGYRQQNVPRVDHVADEDKEQQRHGRPQQ